MDRQIVYPGSIPLDTDLLNVQRNTLVALGSLAESVLGSGPVADGLSCTPSGSGFSVVIGPGSVSSAMASDTATFGSLPADPTVVVKTGVNPAGVVLQLGTNADQNTVLCWLVQAQLTEQDSQPLTLQYWNAAAPTVPFAGPGNSGTAQNTRRQMVLTLSTKASSPVPVGSFAPPAADPGAIGLYCVTTWVGKSGVTADDIVPLPTAPFLQYHLPDLTPGFSRQALVTASGNWVVPAGVKRIRVRVVGAGGGGGGGTTSFGGGGGGAGGYAEAILGVQPGQSFSIAVGAGGAPSAPNNTASAGGSTSFGSSVVATGGLGGASANPDSHGGGAGTGTVGTILLLGGMGGDGATVAGVPAGNGGSSRFGGGGRGANGGGAPADGKAPGSGAGGGYGTNATGGYGAAGLVIVEY